VVYVLNDVAREEDFLGSLWFPLSLSLYRCSAVIDLTLTSSLNNTLKQQTEAAELDTGEDASMGIEKRISAERMARSVKVK
jgi:hypothetical protein